MRFRSHLCVISSPSRGPPVACPAHGSLSCFPLPPVSSAQASPPAPSLFSPAVLFFRAARSPCPPRLAPRACRRFLGPPLFLGFFPTAFTAPSASPVAPGVLVPSFALRSAAPRPFPCLSSAALFCVPPSVSYWGLAGPFSLGFPLLLAALACSSASLSRPFPLLSFLPPVRRPLLSWPSASWVVLCWLFASCSVVPPRALRPSVACRPAVSPPLSAPVCDAPSLCWFAVFRFRLPFWPAPASPCDLLCFPLLLRLASSVPFPPRRPPLWLVISLCGTGCPPPARAPFGFRCGVAISPFFFLYRLSRVPFPPSAVGSVGLSSLVAFARSLSLFFWFRGALLFLPSPFRLPFSSWFFLACVLRVRPCSL